MHAQRRVACLRKAGRKEVRTFSTMTEDLLRVLDWLPQAGCRHVALESTGVYWRPVLNRLAGALDVGLTTARDAQGDTARKTAVSDAEGLGDLLRHGLLKPPASFPPSPSGSCGS